MKFLRNILCLLSVSVLAQNAFAVEEDIGEDGYNKTYNDPSVSFKDRMKSARKEAVVSTENTHGGFVLGFAGDLGPVYDANPDSSSGMGFGLGVEPGYTIQSDSWSRLEFAAQIAYHSFSWKSDSGVDATLQPFSVVPKFGFGHSLGNNLFGIVRFGFGFATGQLKLKQAGVSGETDSKMGFVASGDYDIGYGSGTAQFIGGFGVTHYKYAFSELSTEGNKYDIDHNLNLNHVNVHAGMRLQF